MTTAFSKNLRALRERKNLSQRELANKINVTNATISGYEKTGQYPQKQRIKDKLLEVLECSEIDLFGYSDGYFYRQITGLQSCKTSLSNNDFDINKKLKPYLNKPFTEKIYYEIVNLPNSSQKIVYSYFIDNDKMDKTIPLGSIVHFKKANNIKNCVNHIALIKIDNTMNIGRLRKIENIDAYILAPESNNPKHQIVQIPDNSNYKLIGIAESFSYKGAKL